MPQSNFTSSSFQKFKIFHIQLNSYVKLSVSAIDYLSDNSRSKNDLSFLIEKLILDAGEKWTTTRFIEPFDELIKLRSQLTQSGIMWVYSSFEVFLNHVNSSCSIAIINKEKKERTELVESIRLKELYDKFKWNLDELKYLIPAFNFYGLARHCIVHNMGKASIELKEMALSEEFKTTIENWPTVMENRKLSPAPIINKDSVIEFNPHHAITYSDICFRIAKNVNENILNLLGINYFVLKIIKKELLDKNVLTKPVCSDLYSYTRFNLRKYYNFGTVATNEIKAILEEKEILNKCNKKYITIKTLSK